jgi:hypothetical protein
LVTVSATALQLCKASKDTIWNILLDVDNWDKWASDKSSDAYLISHKTIKRESDSVVICDEEEVDAGYHIKHTDKYTFYAQEHRLTEDVLDGPIAGTTFDLRLTEIGNGQTTTRIEWQFNVKPTTLKFKIVGLFRGKTIVQKVAESYCRQLVKYAETIQSKQNKQV